MAITLLHHLMLMSKIYVVNSDMKNVRGMSDPNVMFKGTGSKLSLTNSTTHAQSIVNKHKL